MGTREKRFLGQLVFLIAPVCLFSIHLLPALAETISGFAEANNSYNKGDYSSAMVQFRRLADKYPADPSIHCMVGMCYLKQGKTEQARRELQWVANYSQNPQAKQYAQSALASLNRPATGTPGSQGQGVRQDGANSPPRNLVHDSVYETVKVAAQNGWEPCPGKCLKLSTPGWGKRTVQGHPDSDNWFTFNQGQPTEYWYSQYHAGHIIVTSSDKSAVDSGACPICNGTGWVRKR